MNAFDLSLFHWLNGFAGHERSLDDLMIAAAKYSPFVIAAVLLACWATWRPAWQRAAALAGLAALLALGVGQLIGAAFPRARPYQVTTATVLVTHAPDTSFPSDHATLCLAVAVLLWTVSRRLGLALGVFSLLVLIARVYIGVHYPTDVIGGALLGAGGAWVTLRLARTPMIARALDTTFALLGRMHLAASSRAAGGASTGAE